MMRLLFKHSEHSEHLFYNSFYISTFGIQGPIDCGLSEGEEKRFHDKGIKSWESSSSRTACPSIVFASPPLAKFPSAFSSFRPIFFWSLRTRIITIFATKHPNLPLNHSQDLANMTFTRSLGALRAPTSNWWPFGPA